MDVPAAAGREGVPQRRQHIERGLARLRDERVHVHDARDPPRDTARDTGHDHSAITVSHKDDVSKVVGLDKARDLIDVHQQPHVRGRLLRAFADTRERGRVHRMSGSLKFRHDPRPAPGTDERAVH
jgi:hypothetical protein